MSGKSAILRQTALIVLLAQMGCFVPALSAEIGIIDKLFTCWCSDNLSLGESTFMVEMIETASIINNISEKSLVLLDEIDEVLQLMTAFLLLGVWWNIYTIIKLLDLKQCLQLITMN